MKPAQKTSPIRAATKDDATAMAELVNMAGEGLPVYLWRRMAKAGEDVWEIGRQRAQREEGSFSYRNTIVRETDEKVAAALIGYPLPETPEAFDPADMPAMFVPLQELENLAPGTWYVNVLATYPEHRGKGFARELLQVADRLAAEARTSGLSIIVSDANVRARKLYESCRYLETASRQMVKEDWENAGTNWVLLVKRL
ncbi:GNAT family N-acetyltransferase [Afifella aestuarii]|uniref:GNAT family N-acetyltransferase n=1 Tax=Afifella aestuarii TaxID=1909496 RepID=UPI001FE926A5|nr:GNAT family N-acetyltransferase [Afifella aestuarii]